MTTYSVDPAHSEIAFSVRHMMFAKVRGSFRGWKASLAYDDSNPARSTVRVEVDTSTIDTQEGPRDAHLRSTEFFDADRFPTIVFESKRVEPAGRGRYKLIGDLRIRDVQREVSLTVEETGRGKDPWGNVRLGFAAKGCISRAEWGLKWNQALETGGVLVSDRVDIEVEAEVVGK